MNIEEQLRSAIREYTETIKPDGSAWGRIQEGMRGPSRARPWRPLIMAAVTVTALAAIISVRLIVDGPVRELRLTNPPPGVFTPLPEDPGATTEVSPRPAPVIDGRWKTMPTSPSKSHYSSGVWTGRELLLWQGRGSQLGKGLAYNPATNRWRALPSFVVGGFYNAPAVWTGTEMIVWGGARDESGGDPTDPPPREGGAYNPSTDRWRRIARAPLYGGWDHSAVWTGSEMLVWGSKPDGSGLQNEIAAYDPEADRWRELSAGPLTGRGAANIVWTGSQLLVWGGETVDGRPVDGAAFDPATGRWSPIPDAPLSPRRNAAAVWTGTELFVWGGQAPDDTNLADGARYDPEADRWTKTAPSPLAPRYYASIVDTPSGVFVWGGIGLYVEGEEGPPHFKDGAVYDAESDRWSVLPGPPLAGRQGAELVVAGKTVIIWGGCCPSSEVFYTDGAIFTFAG